MSSIPRGETTEGQYVQVRIKGHVGKASKSAEQAIEMSSAHMIAAGESEVAGVPYSHAIVIDGSTPSRTFLERIAISEFSHLQSPTYSFVKRALDVVFASIAVVVTSPLLLAIAMAIKISSRGPVFFRQERVGKGGRTFGMLKFRTMRVADKDFTDKAWRAADDPRTTRVGLLLRRTSLDELPQFFNVLVGDMSVVGPRPERPYFVKRFAMSIPDYQKRHLGEVGITGLAQIQGYRGDTCIQSRVAYDIQYLRNWSLALDAKIVWLTTKSIFIRGRG